VKDTSPSNNENPPSPPLSKGGMGGFGIYFLGNIKYLKKLAEKSRFELQYTNQSIIVWTLKIKSLLPSLYKREEFPLFEKEGLGEIFTTICFFNYGPTNN
jgi:hypothetical protein